MSRLIRALLDLPEKSEKITPILQAKLINATVLS